MTRAKLFVGVCAGSLLLTNPLRAQGIRLFVMGSGSFLENERFFALLSDRYRSNYATGGKLTLGAEYTPGKILGFEGAYGYGTNNLRLADLSAPSSPQTGYGIHFQRFSGNLVAHSPISLLGVRPYVSGGVEYDRLSPTSQAKTTAFTQGFAGQLVTISPSNKIGVNYGGGVEWSVLPLLGLRLDLHDHLTGTPTYGLPSRSFPISGAAHNVELSAGVSLHLGK